MQEQEQYKAQITQLNIAIMEITHHMFSIQHKISALQQITHWLIRNYDNVGLLRGNTPLIKFIDTMADEIHDAHNETLTIINRLNTDQGD